MPKLILISLVLSRFSLVLRHQIFKKLWNNITWNCQNQLYSKFWHCKDLKLDILKHYSTCYLTQISSLDWGYQCPPWHWSLVLNLMQNISSSAFLMFWPFWAFFGKAREGLRPTTSFSTYLATKEGSVINGFSAENSAWINYVSLQKTKAEGNEEKPSQGKRRMPSKCPNLSCPNEYRFYKNVRIKKVQMKNVHWALWALSQ